MKASSRSYLGLGAILLFAIILRVYWLCSHTVAIESGDGAEYTRIAENLLNGKGYVGTMGGPELIFPPLYPLAIAAFALVTRSPEFAGRLVSLLGGVCVIPLVFAIALRAYSRRVAFIAASLTACNFVLIGLSASILSEALFTPLLLAGTYFGVRALEVHALPKYVFAGFFFGLAYLTRPEAMVLPLLLALISLGGAWPKKSVLKQVAPGCLALGCCFLFVAAPYIAFLSFGSGRLLLDGIHNMDYTIGQRLNSGMNEVEANWGLTEGEQAKQGPLLDPDLFITRSPYPESLQALLSYLEKSIQRNAAHFFHVIFGWTLGGPILFFTAIGLFRRPWNRERAVREVFLLSVAGFLLALGLSAFLVRARYIIPVLPFVLLWASNGMVELSEWASETMSELQSRIRNNTDLKVKASIQCALTLFAVLAALGARRTIPELADISPRYVADKQAGLALRGLVAHTNGKIIDGLPVLPSYANGLWVPLPSASARDALTYIRRQDPAFVVLRGEQTNYIPYYKNWVEQGIPDARAKLIYGTGTSVNDEIEIYRWGDSRRRK